MKSSVTKRNGIRFDKEDELTPECGGIHCPLCRHKEIELFFKDKKRSFLHCFNCNLVFVPRQYWLTHKEEKAIYDLHENHPHDQGYQRFLSRLSTPLLQKLCSGQNGLDFGCGPGPVLSVLLEEQGHKVDLYDPYYHKDPLVFNKNYDFVTATEVVEHFNDPEKEFALMFTMLKRGGWLGIMTKLMLSKEAFSQWHYIRDMTHVGFYSQGTFEYIARRFNAELHLLADDVILLKKK